MSYTVEVTREGGVWIADVLDLPGAHTNARNLEVLERHIQEVIGLVLDRPDFEVFDVNLVFKGVDEDFARAVELGKRREELDAEHEQLVARTAQSAITLVGKGYSMRDIGPALRMTHGRVGQIVRKAT